jgi:hypothetical protein
MADDPEIRDEIDDAKQDLRDALHQINHRVEERVAQLRPARGIRKRPITTACVAGALGFALGSDSRKAAMVGLLLLGGAIVLAHESKVGDAGEGERI